MNTKQSRDEPYISPLSFKPILSDGVDELESRLWFAGGVNFNRRVPEHSNFRAQAEISNKEEIFITKLQKR
jgi:hypothetical protein